MGYMIHGMVLYEGLQIFGYDMHETPISTVINIIGVNNKTNQFNKYYYRICHLWNGTCPVLWSKVDSWMGKTEVDQNDMLIYSFLLLL